MVAHNFRHQIICERSKEAFRIPAPEPVMNTPGTTLGRLGGHVVFKAFQRYFKIQPKNNPKSWVHVVLKAFQKLPKSTNNCPNSSPKWSKIEVWGMPGRLLEPIGASWSCLGASWGRPGAFWARLGTSWGRLGRRPGRVLGRLWGVLGGLRYLLRHPRAPWGVLGTSWA